MSAEAVAIAAVGVGLLAVLVPLILTLHGRVVAEIGEVRRDLHAVAERVAHVEAGMQSLDGRVARIEASMLAQGERVARIEGAMSPWRPANGSPAPTTPPETAT